ncbi:MAG: HAD-IIA family hydrolase [Candidatus Thalassarchaeaceae archaeon]|jgi:HAD superfamily hydrolase (TIGR01450 family)|nr:HAD-IIA family hydrolase [Candidatus Thalassarchaeaceae archaeon]
MNHSLNGIKAVFLDLDGTIYLGNELIDGAVEFLNRCDERGVQRFFLSNNSSKSVTEYLAKLHGLGIPAEANDVLLSTHDLLSWLGAEGVTETYLVGTEGMRSMLEEVGVSTRSGEPQYVVLGYDTEIDYEKLATASIHLHNGIPLVASHPDMVCPSPDGGLPDVGAYLALFKATTGVEPTHICGKPNAGMILHKIEELGLQPSDCAMVGDRLYTDMEMAAQADVVGVLVLSGEATLDDLEAAPQTPDVIVDSVANLF